jgi:hypothetical protein
VIRRLAVLPIALVATLSILLGACSSTPPAPALTDPKEIVAKGVTSLTGVKTVEFTGTFSGSAAVAQLGSFDLSSIKLAGAVDLASRNARVSLDAPSIVGTKIDAVVVGGTAYYKVAGLLATFIGGRADKFTAMPLPTASGDPVATLTDITKVVSELQAGLARLPAPLTKAANESCGDADCYHVTTALTGEQLRALGGDATVADAAVTIDLWTRTSDYRPAKLAFSLASATLGTFGATLELRYDVGVSVSAPGADQIAP